MKRRSETVGFTLVELLVVITIIGILIALLLPAVQAAREAARKSQCGNNLKQASLAMLAHEERYKFFPSGGWGWQWVGIPDRGSNRNQPGSWVYNILPFIEQQDLHDLGSDGIADSMAAAKIAACTQRIQTPLASMICPTRRPAVPFPIGGGATRAFNDANAISVAARTDYAACAGDLSDDQWSGGPADFASAATFTWPPIIGTATGVCYLRSEVTTAMITDGLSNTYMLGEKYLNSDCYFDGSDLADNETMYSGYDNDNQRTTDYAPTNSPPIIDTPMQDTAGLTNWEIFGSAHANSCNMSFCDGSVQAISYSIDPETHRRLGNRQDDLPVDPKQFQ
jgi:prepilin-type N-terminal cleavage/methylation domain-containing protein/prepilin-type processing-associated H-X9-DG protein